MENSKIEEFETIIRNTRKLTERFNAKLQEGRERDNYNHLGTLDVNCKCLKIALERLINTLEY